MDRQLKYKIDDHQFYFRLKYQIKINSVRKSFLFALSLKYYAYYSIRF
jgi:hypothetical protein